MGKRLIGWRNIYLDLMTERTKEKHGCEGPIGESCSGSARAAGCPSFRHMRTMVAANGPHPALGVGTRAMRKPQATLADRPFAAFHLQTHESSPPSDQKNLSSQPNTPRKLIFRGRLERRSNSASRFLHCCAELPIPTCRGSGDSPPLCMAMSASYAGRNKPAGNGRHKAAKCFMTEIFRLTAQPPDIAVILAKLLNNKRKYH